MELEITLNVTCTGQIIKGRKLNYSQYFGNWLPEEPDTVENFKIFIGQIEITSELTPDEIEDLKQEFIKEI